MNLTDGVPPPAYDIAARLEDARHEHHMHHHPSGYVRPADLSVGRCGWRWHWEDSTILCWHYDLPGTGLCAHHYAEVVVFHVRVLAAIPTVNLTKIRPATPTPGATT